VKTIFLSRYLRHEKFRREIHEGLNVVENWNSATSFVFFGKSGEIARIDSCARSESIPVCGHVWLPGGGTRWFGRAAITETM
jgi:hypothetical protein